MEERSYTLEELDSHLKKKHTGHDSPVPFTPLRLSSYLQNPRAEPSDHVLFEMYDGNKLIAYRTLLPDCFYDQKGDRHRFAWLSGNYVVPAYRRKGISTRLLQLAEARWEGHLMYTNYAPQAKAVFDKTGQFQLLLERDGSRFYLRAASSDLLKERVQLGPVLGWGDQVVNAIRETKLSRFDLGEVPGSNISRITAPDRQLQELIDASSEGSLFRRDVDIFSWILQHPWVTNENVESLPYQFSYMADRFENILFKIELAGDEGYGMLWLILHNRKLSAPYLFASNEKVYPHMARTFMQTMIGMKVAYATIRNPFLERELRSYQKWFLSIRNMPQQVFVHQMLAGRVPSEFTFQDGDGDVVFTG
jgi:GNAT superfamily N-acetyltransferase